MAGTKSLASLTPTLLARKGGAKPAMRPQLQPLAEFHEATARDMGEDLGWNDMGHEDEFDDEAADGGADVVSIVGEARTHHAIPEVVRQQVHLNGSIAASPVQRRSAIAQGRRAAFTLRLDADRHLKLRLASAVLNRSAQDIVTEALDGILADLDQVEAFAAEVSKNR